MSNSDDVKPPGPPTLFGNEPDAGAAGQTRILASLEGRVPMAAKAPASKRGRGYVTGGLVAVAAAAVAGWLWLDPGADAPVPMQADKPSAPAHSGASATAPGAQALAGHAPGSSPATAVAPSEPVHAAEAPQPQAATIVDAGSSDPVLDSLGKVDGATAAAGAAAGAVTGATTLAALTALGSQPATARPQSAEISKSSKKASSAKAASSAAKSTTNAASSKDKAAVAKSSTAAKPSRTARRKASSAAADPDAEVLAALLSQPEGKPISTAASTRPSAKARN